MAKDKKNAAQAAAAENAAEKEQKTAQVVINEDNIEDQIKSENKMGDNALAEAEAQIAKEKDEKKVRILKQCITKADYVNKREVLELRKRRKEADATKKSLTASKEALDDLKVGKITPNEYESKLEEFDTQKRKDFQEIDKKHNELVEELRDGYSGYYSWDWEYERRCSRY